ADGVKESLQPVEIARGDRIVFVIVTARTADGETEKDRAGRRRNFVEIVLPDVRRDQVRAIPRREPQKRYRDVALDIGLIIVAGVAVFIAAGQWQDDEAVVRHVRVDRVDHPIAIPPGVADRAVPLQAAGLTIANEVEPVASPALAVARIAEQTIDEFFVS